MPIEIARPKLEGNVAVGADRRIGFAEFGDPQGRAIHHALEGLGFDGINDVRAGKLIELDLADGTSDEDIDGMCRKLLANTVIENYRIEKVA